MEPLKPAKWNRRSQPVCPVETKWSGNLLHSLVKWGPPLADGCQRLPLLCPIACGTVEIKWICSAHMQKTKYKHKRCGQDFPRRRWDSLCKTNNQINWTEKLSPNILTRPYGTKLTVKISWRSAVANWRWQNAPDAEGMFETFGFIPRELVHVGSKMTLSLHTDHLSFTASWANRSRRSHPSSVQPAVDSKSCQISAVLLCFRDMLHLSRHHHLQN